MEAVFALFRSRRRYENAAQFRTAGVRTMRRRLQRNSSFTKDDTALSEKTRNSPA
ncbi:hypothetical protein HanIR_Chr11g0510371 [Helianthus annuus]|nr:hypothetical protein HanIR_Chr11g0510371 [Helianthus annuus]KAJ0516217.1 hypothetical protein HanHA89_Chr11g0411371 [Helianthus annuus]